MTQPSGAEGNASCEGERAGSLDRELELLRRRDEDEKHERER